MFFNNDLILSNLILKSCPLTIFWLLFSWFNNVSVYFTNFSIHIKIFFISINPSKFTIKMLFILFSFLTSSFSFLSLCPFSSDSNASLCLGKYKSIHSLKLNVAVIFFHLQMLSLFFFNTDCSLVLIISCCLNPNLDLN